jgi:hypothetical protein
MAKINFDFKAFLLKHGERVGFGVAAGVMALMLLAGLIKFFGSGSAGANARTLESETKTKKQALASAQPDRNLSFVDPDLLRQNVSGPVDGFLYPLSQELVEAGTVTDSKRRPPRIFGPEEIATAVVYGQIDGVAIKEGPKGEMVQIVENGAPKRDKNSPSFNSLSEMMGGMGGGAKGMGLGRGGMGMGMGGMRGGGGAGGGDVGPGGFGGPGYGDMNAFMAPNSKGRTNWILWNEMERTQQKANVRLADQLVPQRMVYVAASFPYKKELEEFQTKLRFPTLYDLLADEPSMPHFKRLEVQRRTIRPDGKPAPVLGKDGKPVPGSDGWASIDIKEQTLNWLVTTAGQTEPDDERIANSGIVVYGLAMPRPKLLIDRDYPKLEDKLELIKKTLDALEGKNKVAVAPPPSLKDKSRYDPFSPDGRNPNSPDNPADMLTPGAPGVPGVPGPGGLAGGAQGPGRLGGAMRPGGEDVRGGMGGKGLPPGSLGGTFTSLQDYPVPEHLLLRFVDVDVKPGETYEYRLSLVLFNPNFQKPNVAWDSVSKDEELRGDWYVLPQLVRVPLDLRYYAVEEKGTDQNRTNYPPVLKDQAALQIHRWVDNFAPNSPDERRRDHLYPVGDWLIADHVAVFKGERVNHIEPVDVPMYDPIDDAFILHGFQPGSKGRGVSKKVRIAFGPLTKDVVLLDITGGSQKYQRAGGAGTKAAEMPREVLLLTTDGRIEVRNQDLDTIDQDRIERRKTWSERIRDLKYPKPMMNPIGPGGAGGGRGT